MNTPSESAPISHTLSLRLPANHLARGISRMADYQDLIQANHAGVPSRTFEGNLTTYLECVQARNKLEMSIFNRSLINFIPLASGSPELIFRSGTKKLFKAGERASDFSSYGNERPSSVLAATVPMKFGDEYVKFRNEEPKFIEWMEDTLAEKLGQPRPTRNRGLGAVTPFVLTAVPDTSGHIRQESRLSQAGPSQPPPMLPTAVVLLPAASSFSPRRGTARVDLEAMASRTESSGSLDSNARPSTGRATGTPSITNSFELATAAVVMNPDETNRRPQSPTPPPQYSKGKCVTNVA